MKSKGRFARQLRRRDARSRRHHARRAAAAAALAAGALVATGGQAQAAFPGSNGLIAFDSDVKTVHPEYSPFDVWTLDPANPPPATVPNAVAQSVGLPDRQPTWAPDGVHIAYTSIRPGVALGNQVWVQDDYRVPSSAHPVTTSTFNRGTLAWSPDMSEIAFTKFVPGSGLDVYAVNVGSGTERLVASSPLNDANPTWSPDGRYIAFDSNKDGDSNIYRVLADGSQASDPTLWTNLTPGTPTSDELHPDYSPGGSAILFDSNHNDPGNVDIYGKFANTSTQMFRLTSNAAVDNIPSFSPDGRKFTFQSDRSDSPNTDVWVQNLIPDTSPQAAPTDVTNDATALDGNPDWQPVGGMCPTPPPGGGSASTVPPLPVEPTYPLSATSVTAGLGNSTGAADNDVNHAGSSDAGMPPGHPGDSSTGGQACPGNPGSSDHGGGGAGGSTGS